MTNAGKKILLFFLLVMLWSVNVLAQKTDSADSNEYESIIGYVDTSEVFFAFPELSEYEKKEQAINQEYDLKSQKIEDAKELSKEEKDLLLVSLMIEKKGKITNLWKPVYSEIRETINRIRISKKMGVVLKKGEVVSGGYDITREVIMEIENKR